MGTDIAVGATEASCEKRHVGSAELERSVLSRGEDVWREEVKPGAT